MTTRVAWVAALIGLAVVSPLAAHIQPEAQLERAAERRFRSAEQFYAGGRHGQALRDFEAIVETMPESRLADDAALRIARHRFDVEGDPVAAEEMVDRLFRSYPAGDSIPGAHLLLGEIAAKSLPPRLEDARAEFERALMAAGSAGSPWSFAALTGIAVIASDFMDDETAAGALLSALHETRAAPASVAERFRARLLLARTLGRLGDADAALGEVAGLRADLLRRSRDEPANGGGPADSGRDDFSAAGMAEEARELATLIARYRSSGGPGWRFAGAIQPPQRLDRPRRVRVAGGSIHVLDRDTDEVQTFSPAGDFEGALGVDDPWDLAYLDRGTAAGAPAIPVVAADEALVVGGNLLTLRPGAGAERLRRMRAVTVTPEGFWVWDDREKAVFRFARSGLFLGRVPHSRLDEVHRIERHPAGHLIVVEDRQGVLAFDAEGRRIFHLTRNSGFSEPVDVAFDGLGNLFVLARDGPALGVFDRDFAPLANLAAGEWPGGGVRRPVSLDVGPDGVLYVLDESTRAVTVLR
jgi:tetratricopeptide (TPR) repeat protein